MGNCVAMWPRNPSRVPGRAHTCLSASPTSRTDAIGVGTQVPGGPLRTTAIQHSHQCAGRADAGERGRPTEVAKQRDERDGGKNLAQLADDGRQLSHHGHPSSRKPTGDERQRRREDDRVAGTDKHSGRGRDGHGRRIRQQDLPTGQQNRVGDEHRPRPVTVHQESGQDVRHGEHAHLDEHEGGQGAGAESETVGRVEAGSGQGGALHDRQDVGEYANGPDQPGSAGPRRHCGGIEVTVAPVLQGSWDGRGAFKPWWGVPIVP